MLIRNCRSRRGITLIETVVVAATVCLLVILAIPAVQAEVEAARRTTCQDNLRQIGQAFQKHHEAYGAFPPCRTNRPAAHGFCVNLLPFIDRNDLYEAWRFDKPFHDPENEPVARTAVSTFQCPTAPDQNRIVKLRQASLGPFYGTEGVAGDYFVTHGLNGGERGERQHPALLTNERQPISKITDGASCTTLVLEHAGHTDHYIRGVKQENYNKSVHPGWWGAWTSFQSFTYQGYTADGTANGKECSINCNNAQGIYSFHPKGANTLFCDGRVRFLADSVPVDVVLALASRDGGEILSVDDYGVVAE
ncbi:MAG TPA: DUF1559 domain-containing protein [Pirellulales bacterium]|jgi:prepilin-type processing-associated H-X9-DG protein